MCDDLVAPNWVLHQPNTLHPGSGPEEYHSRICGLRAAFRPGAARELRAKEQFCLGDHVVTRWTTRGTHSGELGSIPRTGKMVERTEVSIKRFAEGKVAETWMCTDALPLRRQVGTVLGDADWKGW